MADDKSFLTYNKQMRHLRDNKKIDCHDSRHKNIHMLIDLQSKLSPNAFDYIRAHMGIKNLEDLLTLKGAPKDKIDYNKYDRKAI